MEAVSTPSSGLAERLACADSTFPKLSHEGALAVIRDLGLSAVDICVFDGYDHSPPEAIVGDPGRAADAVLGRLDRTGLVVADVFGILSTPYDRLAVNHPDGAVRREALRQFGGLMEFARRLDAPGITILPGVTFDGVDPDESLALAAAELQTRAELAGEAGMRLSIEPHYGSIVPDPAKTLQLLAHAPDVTLALDYSHFVFQGIPQHDVDVLIPRTRHVHLRQAAPGVMQARMREGTIDFGVLLGQLASAGYDGYLTLEYQWDEWFDCDRVDCVSETAELRDLVGGL